MQAKQKLGEWSYATHVQRQFRADHYGTHIGVVAIVTAGIEGESEGAVEIPCRSHSPTGGHTLQANAADLTAGIHVGISGKQVELGGAEVFGHLPDGGHRQAEHNDHNQCDRFAEKTAADFHSNSSEGFL